MFQRALLASGLPQPDLGHRERIECLRRLEREWPGLSVTGNDVAGVSTTGCIDAALDATGRAMSLRATNPGRLQERWALRS